LRYLDKVDFDDLQLSHMLIAYLSDLTLVATGLLPYQEGVHFKLSTSLDHSIWYHSFRFDVNEWLLYEQECVAHSESRSLVHAKIWSRSGKLLASTAQEVLVYAADEEKLSKI